MLSTAIQLQDNLHVKKPQNPKIDLLKLNDAGNSKICKRQSRTIKDSSRNENKMLQKYAEKHISSPDSSLNKLTIKCLIRVVLSNRMCHSIDQMQEVSTVMHYQLPHHLVHLREHLDSQKMEPFE